MLTTSSHDLRGCPDIGSGAATIRRPGHGDDDSGMKLKPKTPADLSLAPVAAEIDLNLQSLRDEQIETVADAVALALNSSPAATREGRAAQVLEVALRGVDLRGWHASVSDDATRVHLSGGSVTLDLGLSARIRDFVEQQAA